MQWYGVLSLHFDFLLLAFFSNSFCHSNIFQMFTLFDITIVSGALSFGVSEHFWRILISWLTLQRSPSLCVCPTTVFTILNCPLSLFHLSKTKYTPQIPNTTPQVPNTISFHQCACHQCYSNSELSSAFHLSFHPYSPILPTARYSQIKQPMFSQSLL